MIPELHEQIEEAREKIRERHIEAIRCKQAWHIAEELHAGARLELDTLLTEAKRPVMTAAEHNANPGGRW